MTSFKLNFLSKSPSPNAITLGVRDSMYEYWRDSIQSTVPVHGISVMLTNMCLYWLGMLVRPTSKPVDDFIIVVLQALGLRGGGGTSVKGPAFQWSCWLGEAQN